MSNLINQQWRLLKRPENTVRDSDLEWTEEAVPEIKSGEILIRNIYLSIDPAIRGWMRPERTYVSPIKIGDVVRGIGLGVIEASTNSKFHKGDIVNGLVGWQRYLISDGTGFTKISPMKNIPLTAYLSIFGMIGLTAYFGLLDIGKPQRNEILAVSAGAGAVGSLVGQIGKIMGCRVIGITGTEEKCRWITDGLGFDKAINYKTENVRKRLRELCPNGIDIFFDNVGGPVLDSFFANLNKNARVVICGFISQYNDKRPSFDFSYFGNVLFKRATVRGFIVTDYFNRSERAFRDLASWHQDGLIKYREEVIKGLESAPLALRKIFDGSNQGKTIVQVSDYIEEHNRP
ncbi:MAG: NADP-dependent oxidoreductase [Candidatus Heimdallarchaeota archaeon]